MRQGGTDVRTYGRTYGQIPPVFYRTLSPSGPLPKNDDKCKCVISGFKLIISGFKLIISGFKLIECYLLLQIFIKNKVLDEIMKKKSIYT